MGHHHSCQCSHDSVKYCKVCHIVHCLDCNQEWRSKRHTIYNNPWYGNTGIWDGLFKDSDGHAYSLTNASQAKSDKAIESASIKVCNHGG